MMAAVQRRTGPYNVGYFGLLQSMDDGLKLVKNEVIILLTAISSMFRMNFTLWK